ncbi:MAG: ABC transporter substrate-binding protein [Bauldia litoralis]
MKKSLLGAALAACVAAAPVAPSVADVKMSVGVGIDPSMAVLYVAEKAGIFKKNGLDVSLKLGPSGSAMFPLVLSEQLQAAVGSEYAAIQVHNLDSNVVVVAEVTRMPVWAGIIGRGVSTLEGLKGKRIGVQKGSGSELTWLAIVKSKKLNPKDYKVVAVDPPEMVAALERRDIDAFVAFEPWMTRATLNVSGAKWIVDNKGILDPRNFAVMNKKWIEKNKAASEAFVRALAEAGDYLVANPAKSAEIVSARIRLELPLTTALLKKLKYDVRLVSDTVHHFKETEQQIKSGGRLKKNVVWKELIFPDLLRAVRPDRVKGLNLQ